MEETKRTGRRTTLALLVVIVLAMAAVVALFVHMLRYSTTATVGTADAPAQEDVPAADAPQTAVPDTENAAPDDLTAPSVPALSGQDDAQDGSTQTGAADAAASEPDAAQRAALSSAHVLLLDLETNAVIYEQDADAKIYPASMTKILTALVACEQITDWSDTFRMTQAIIDPLFLADATMAGFIDSEDVALLDLVYGTILPSGAEATEGLAQYIAGSEEAFVALMNEKAAALGLTTAHFVDASGLHDPEHYCTIRDMAVILQAALENDICQAALSTARYTSSATNKHPDGVEMVNKFLVRAAGQELGGAQILAAKTGYTAQAGNCCASYGKSAGGREYICVTANAPDSWDTVYDHVALYSQYAP